jgi:ankyrin repeat protein
MVYINIGVVSLKTHTHREMASTIALVKAVKNNQVEVVARLLHSGTDPNGDKGYPLFWAAREGHTEVVRLLLEAGVEPQSDGFPLFWAAREGHTEVVRLLLEAGVEPQSNGFPLFWAAREGHTEVVRLLLQAGADPCDPRNAYLSLSWAARNGHSEVVHMLLEKGAHPNLDDGRPIRNAAQNGHGDIVRLLEIVSQPWTIGKKDNLCKMPPFVKRRALTVILCLRKHLCDDVINHILSFCTAYPGR